MYNQIYQLTHDMDCFFVLNGIPTHFASNGCIVPSKLGTIEELREMQVSVAKMDGCCGFELNWGYLSRLNAEDFPNEEDMKIDELDNPIKGRLFGDTEFQNIPFHWKLYSHSFAEMATKGYWSFDRIGEDEKGRDQFVLIAWPKDKKKKVKKPVCNHFIIDSFSGWCTNKELCIWPLTEMIYASELK